MKPGPLPHGGANTTSGASLIRARPTAELRLLAKRPEKAGLTDAKLQQILGHGLRRADDALRDLAGSR